MEIGTVKVVDIDQEVRGAYLDYAMSVITARALPDVRDGLKPVQRRILYAMNELNLAHTSPYKKSARIVGEVLGKYHPHGDDPVYEAMVRMAQDFSMRYVLVDGQGNFGSVDGDPPAAMRYTEARLAAVAEEILLDIEKNTVDFADNFDGSLKEPSVLPARLPNLLINGAAGIAVGMATNIPPHNLAEVADAIIFMIDQFQRVVAAGIPFDIAQARVHNQPLDREALLALRKRLSPDFMARVAAHSQAKLASLEKAPKGKQQKDELDYEAMLDALDEMIDVPLERLMEFIAGPDFPTGGIIVGRKGITDAYSTGHGRLIIRAKAFTEDRVGDKSTIIVTELPYQVNKATLIEKIADLVRDKRIEGIAELRDESDRQGMRIVIELRRDVPARQILNNLFRLTAMQSTFSVNLLALVDGEPRVLTLKRLLQHHIDYRHHVITRRTQFELEKARARAHILQGLKIALDHLDEVISTIRNSPDADTARDRLMKRFKLTEVQAQAILDMQLRRLAALERKKVEQELADTLKLIAHLEDLLAQPVKMYGLIRNDLLDLKQKYGDQRRTRILEEEAEEFTAEDLIPDEDVAVILTARDYIKRVPADLYRAQARRPGSRAITAVVSKEQDPPAQVVIANTHDTIVFLTNVGKAYALKCHELPAGDRQVRGVPLSNFISTAMSDEHPAAIIATRDQNDASLTLVTRRAEIKRVALADMIGVRASGINVMALEQGDEVIWAGITRPKDEIIIVTAQGRAIRFDPEAEVRVSGRGSGGVRGLRLDAGDHVVGAGLIEQHADLMVISTRGLGKRTPLKDYPAQGRGGGGIVAATISEKNGPLAAARVIARGDDAVIISAHGQTVRRPYEEIPAQGRSAMGARLIELEKSDKPVAILRLSAEKKASAAAEPTPVQAALPDTTAAEKPAPRRKKAAERAAPTGAGAKPQQAAPKREAKQAEAAPIRLAAGKPTGKAAAPKPAPAAKAAARAEAPAPPAKPAAKPSAKRRAGAPPAPEAAELVLRKAVEPAVKPATPVTAKIPAQAPTKAVTAERARPTRTAAEAKKPARQPVKRLVQAEPLAPAPLPATPTPTPAPSKPKPVRPGKDTIIIRSRGQTTVIPRSALLPEEEAQPPAPPPATRPKPAPAPKKPAREKAKGKDKGFQLPLWGNK